MVDEAPAPGPAICYIEPAEVPNESYGGPVEPLAPHAVHEVRPLPPHPQHKDRPQDEKVDADVPGQDWGEQSERRHTGGDEQQIPQEVDQGGAPALLGFVWEEGAQGAVVVHHHPGDGGGWCSDAHNCKNRS